MNSQDEKGKKRKWREKGKRRRWKVNTSGLLMNLSFEWPKWSVMIKMSEDALRVEKRRGREKGKIIRWEERIEYFSYFLFSVPFQLLFFMGFKIQCTHVKPLEGTLFSPSPPSCLHVNSHSLNSSNWQFSGDYSVFHHFSHTPIRILCHYQPSFIKGTTICSATNPDRLTVITNESDFNLISLSLLRPLCLPQSSSLALIFFSLLFMSTELSFFCSFFF